MAKKKTTKTTRKPKAKKRKATTRKRSPSITKEPEYMIQVNDPTMVRKDLLESLRETIIFMQGYETIRKIQEEKVALFTQLKLDVKELNGLVENKLHKYLPRGKIKELVKADAKKSVQQEVRIVKTVGPAKKEPIMEPRSVAPETPKQRVVGGLDELEQQLQDIENQLKGIQ